MVGQGGHNKETNEGVTMKQIKVAHKALKEYENANLWLNLPADQTTNAFLQSIGCTSRHTLESALKRLENFH